jgi:hypothetical protein
VDLGLRIILINDRQADDIMDEELIQIKELEALRIQHRELDNQINEGGLDEFTLRRYKQTKLALRDKITMLERTVYPDIIA